MKINELAQKFMNNDPKQKCIVQTGDNFEVIYEDRIEFLYNCDNPIEEYEVVGLEIGSFNEDEKWIPDILVITAKKK